MNQYQPPCQLEPETYDITLTPAQTPAYQAAVERATAICSGCEIRQQCLAENFDVPGVIAGYTVNQRRGLRVSRAHRRRANNNQPAAGGCGTEGGYQLHRRTGEEPCTACKEAATDARRQRERRRKGTAA